METDTSATTLSFDLTSSAGSETALFSISQAVIAGWTGRDEEAVEKHILELEKLGIQRPASTPIFYRVAAARLTTAGEIQVVGETSSGEVEVILIQQSGQLWVGVGSDHTDREVETYGVTVSKQVCDKPVAPVLWPYAEVVPHWDQMILRSYAGNKKELYQEGPVAKMLPPMDLIKRYTERDSLSDGTLMFGGTLATLGEVQPSERFELELEDPVLNRRITHGYDIRTLPILG
jgi:biotin operon repressor